MTNARPHGLDFRQNRVSVAIDPQFTEFQHMAARFPLFPEFVSGPAEKNDLAASSRLSKRRFVHKTKHKYVARSIILNYGGYQTAHFSKRKFHVSSKSFAAKQKTRWALLRQRAMSALSKLNFYAHSTARGVSP
jgi:hypothetical protein